MEQPGELDSCSNAIKGASQKVSFEKHMISNKHWRRRKAVSFNKFSKKDEGYAWFIVWCSFMVHVLFAGISYTIGVTFVIFLDAFKASTGVTAWVGSLHRASMNFIAPVSSILTNKFGSRPIVILGGVISAIGLGTSALATDIYHLYITFGIIAGSGLGIAYIPANTIINDYFEKKRTIAFGIATSGFGVGSFLYPLLIEGLNEKYGWEGAMLVLSAIGLNICVCGTLMCPFKTSDLHKITKVDKDGAVFNYEILKSLNLLLLCFNYLLFFFGFSVVLTHLSEYSLLMGIGGIESATLFSVLGITNIFGLLMFGAIAHHPKVSSMLLYIVGLFISGAATVALPLLTQYGTLLLYSGMVGFFSATISVLSPIIVCQILGPNEVSHGYGVLLPFTAVGYLLGGPVAGFMYDTLHTYNSSFFVGGGSMIISSLCMVVPYIRLKQNQKEIILEQVDEKLNPLFENT